VGLFALNREYTDALGHPSARKFLVASSRHRAFVKSGLRGSLTARPVKQSA
jgi:hypothetical protein